MEEPISKFGKSLASFCNHLQSSCDALKRSLDRRPIPLDSASSTFIQCLNRRVSTANTDLNLLETMSFGTVSFEELLGHCNEVYKKNQNNLLLLQDRLQNLGYVPEMDDKEEEEDDESVQTCVAVETKDVSIMKSFEEDPLLMDESLSLKSFGLSEVCLATLASEAKSMIADPDPDIFMGESMKFHGDKQHGTRSPDQTAPKTLGVTEVKMENDQTPADVVRPIVEVSKDDYENLPSYMKSLTSWQDLLAAVEKINSSLGMKEKTNEGVNFHQDEIASLGLGPKARTYLLLLTRMNQLAVEVIDGLICYKVLSTK